MSSSSVGRRPAVSWILSSSPSADRSLTIFDRPSSPRRPFSSASSVECPTFACFARMAWLRPSALRLAAICSPMDDNGVCPCHCPVIRLYRAKDFGAEGALIHPRLQLDHLAIYGEPATSFESVPRPTSVSPLSEGRVWRRASQVQPAGFSTLSLPPF